MYTPVFLLTKRRIFCLASGEHIFECWKNVIIVFSFDAAEKKLFEIITCCVSKSPCLYDIIQKKFNFIIN